jgi:4-amino-4-deoxy-L-arabinose transferase-like glycosyltransferase
MGRIPPLQLAIAGCFAFLILAQGISAPFQSQAEPQSAEWIASVADDGHWLFPRDYYGFVDARPPLYYWLSALVAKAGGGKVDETRGRIVSVLCAELIALEVLTWTASEVGVAQGWLAFLFLLGIYSFSSRATLALPGMLMTALLVSGYLLLFSMLQGRISRARVIAAGIVFGLGVLARGPLVLILAAFAALIFLILSKSRPLALLREAWPLQVAALALIIAACWYVPRYVTGREQDAAMSLSRGLGHFASADTAAPGETASFWYVAAHLIGGANPIILLMPATLAGFATGEVSDSQRKALIFQTSLVLAVVIFFSIAGARRDDDVLPALPSVAILSAAAFGMTRPSRDYAGGAKIRDGVSWLIAFAALLAVVLALITARRNPAVSFQTSEALMMTLLERGIGSRSWPFMVFLGFSALAALSTMLLLLKRSTLLAGAGIGLLSLGGVALMNAVVRPELASARSLRGFLSAIRGEIDDHPVYVVRGGNLEWSYYYGRAIPPLIGNNAARIPAGAPSYLIAHRRDLAMLPASYRARLRLVAESHLLGSDDSPVLYLIEAAPADLNPAAGQAR